MKSKMLFVDDRARRIRAALVQYGMDYDVTIAPSVTEALRALAGENFDVVSLDHDLNGEGFQNPESPEAAMEIIRYIAKTGWPEQRIKPVFWVHSYNTFAAQLMIGSLRALGYEAEYRTLKYPKYKVGMIAGPFDIIHPGYIRMFQDAKRVCDYLVIALHIDPSATNPNKMKPVLTVFERAEVLQAIKYVDEVMSYETEADLDKLLAKVDIRIVGSDHRGISTRPELGIPTFYHNRDAHKWSSTAFKTVIAAQVNEFLAKHSTTVVGVES